ncbi:hypothetical protein Y032_0003g1390 [Ancylostoma ceylanicum]|uniref:Uncharacterized protein n=1 Tax=Ancylostoma ceylanicum TaxID=53326 RepID=A0A016VYK9_9BILA|nr:hypothetical protein Y032_0003g1390 [Ancylostoma ceylanicum]
MAVAAAPAIQRPDAPVNAIAAVSYLPMSRPSRKTPEFGKLSRAGISAGAAFKCEQNEPCGKGVDNGGKKYYRSYIERVRF